MSGVNVSLLRVSVFVEEGWRVACGQVVTFVEKMELLHYMGHDDEFGA